MVEDKAFSHKIDYVTIFFGNSRYRGHPNRIDGSKVTAILLNWWILPIVGASAVKGLRLRPAQQACFNCNIFYLKKNYYKVKKKSPASPSQ